MNVSPRFRPDAGLAEAIRRTRLIVFDFDGVFTDNTVYVFQDGREAVRCWRSDGLGLDRLRQAGLDMTVVSTETNAVVAARCQKLKLDCLQGRADKGATLSELLAQRGFAAAQAAYVGNDINDQACLALVGLPIVVADAHPDVRGLARYITTAPGGRGAVREVCDLFHQVLTEAR